MKKTLDPTKQPEFFWKCARTYVYTELQIRQAKSNNTVRATRDRINQYIDYLNTELQVPREKICFIHFSRSYVQQYVEWMISKKKYAPSSVDAHLSAIHSLLEFASTEDNSLMETYLSIKSIKGVKIPDHPIEYFSTEQMKGILSGFGTSTKLERRNSCLFELDYDLGTRIEEVLDLNVGDIYLDGDCPFIRIHAKGDEYRDVPISEKTIINLKQYMKEFHSDDANADSPMFYCIQHGVKHHLSQTWATSLLKTVCESLPERGITKPEKCHSHMIRKTRAMDLYQSGVPLPYIQQLLGHKQISTTSGFYAFATIDMLKKAIEKAETISSPHGEKKWTDPETMEKLMRL